MGSCDFPGCPFPAEEGELCRKVHGSPNGRGRALGPLSIKNDGCIDWTAVEIAYRGMRKVRLTWVEREIAQGMILAEGGSANEVMRKLDMRMPRGDRTKQLTEIGKVALARLSLA